MYQQTLHFQFVITKFRKKMNIFVTRKKIDWMYFWKKGIKLK